MTYSTDVINALARLRQYAAAHTVSAVGTVPNAMASLVNTLDNAGVFAALDEQIDYASAGDILTESAVREYRERVQPDPGPVSRPAPVG